MTMPSRSSPRAWRLVFGVFAGLALASCSRKPAPRVAAPAHVWSAPAAARYLDQREATWEHWPVAARDHGTFCISCHTALPYALARPRLSRTLGEVDPPAPELSLLTDVRERVALGAAAQPYYSDRTYGAGKARQSLGTESVLNALILAEADAGMGALRPDTLAAFAQMWSQQETTGPQRGAWPWLQFHNEPFEAHDSAYYGAALAAVAVGLAPANYREAPAIEVHLQSLRDYLSRSYSHESLLNRLTALWASAKLPDILSVPLKRQTIRDAYAAQQSDGGWSLGPLIWSWEDWSPKSLLRSVRSRSGPLANHSDGYATALAVNALLAAGITRTEPHLARALAWLEENQQPQGFWRSYSPNYRIDPNSHMGLFMSDAATSFAILALTNPKAQP